MLGTIEDRAKCVAHRLKYISIIGLDRLTHELVVQPDGLFHGDAIALPALRAVFDVGEKECYRPCWTFGYAMRPFSLRHDYSTLLNVPVLGADGESKHVSSEARDARVDGVEINDII